MELPFAISTTSFSDSRMVSPPSAQKAVVLYNKTSMRYKNFMALLFDG
jgi:hypothetical protein